VSGCLPLSVLSDELVSFNEMRRIRHRLNLLNVLRSKGFMSKARLMRKTTSNYITARDALNHCLSMRLVYEREIGRTKFIFLTPKGRDCLEQWMGLDRVI